MTIEESNPQTNEFSRKKQMFLRAKIAHKNIVERFQKRILVQKVIDEHRKKIEYREKSEHYLLYRNLTDQVKYPKVNNYDSSVIPFEEVRSILEKQREERKKFEAQEYEKYLESKVAAKKAKARANNFSQKIYVSAEEPVIELPRKPRPPKFRTKISKPVNEAVEKVETKEVNSKIKISKKPKNVIKVPRRKLLHEEENQQIESINENHSELKQDETLNNIESNLVVTEIQHIIEEEEDIDKTNIDDVLNDILRENENSSTIEESEIQALQNNFASPLENDETILRAKNIVAKDLLDKIDQEITSIGTIEGISGNYHSSVYQLDQISGYL